VVRKAIDHEGTTPPDPAKTPTVGIDEARKRFVPLVTLVDGDVLDALLTEAHQLARDPGDLLAGKLCGVLPEMLAEAVRDLLSSENDETPGADSRGSGSTSPKIVAPASIAPRRPSGKPRGDASA
jgi:hypothetical protein